MGDRTIIGAEWSHSAAYQALLRESKKADALLTPQRTVAEKANAIISIARLFHSGLVTAENFVAVVGDITRE